MQHINSESTGNAVSLPVISQPSTSVDFSIPTTARMAKLFAVSTMFTTLIASPVMASTVEFRSQAVHEWRMSYEDQHSEYVPPDDVEQDSPSWVSPQRQALQARGNKRINDPRLARQFKA